MSIPSAARAETPEPAPAPATNTTWYGWQLLAGDASAMGLGYIGFRTQSEELLFFVVPPAFVLGGPTVHAVHGRWGAALVSLNLRLALPLLAVAIRGDDCGRGMDNNSCQVNRLGQGLAIGMATAALIDSLALSWTSTPVEKPAPWAPIASFKDGGATVGLTGVF